jgi:hypothetical protein
MSTGKPLETGAKEASDRNKFAVGRQRRVNGFHARFKNGFAAALVLHSKPLVWGRNSQPGLSL